MLVNLNFCKLKNKVIKLNFYYQFKLEILFILKLKKLIFENKFFYFNLNNILRSFFLYFF